MALVRNIATVGAATMLSRVLGFARDVMIAAAFGAGAVTDAFFVAFQMPNLARRLMAEGALNAAFVPLYLRAHDERGVEASGAFAGRVIGTSIVVLGAAALVAALAMPVIVLLLAPGFGWSDPRLGAAVEFARLMLPYLVVAGPLAALMGVLNAHHRFGATALATIAFNLVLVLVLAAMLAGPWRRAGAMGHALAAAVGLAGLAQLVLVALVVWRGAERASPLAVSFGSEMRGFVALAVPGLVASGIPQLTLIAGSMVASLTPSAISWLYYANRLFELPLGIVAIAIGTVLVPAFTRALRAGDRAALVAAESRGLELALGLALPASVALLVLAGPIVRALFERGAFTAEDTQATALALAALALGLPGHVLTKAFAPAFFAREDTATPMRAALAGFAVAIAGSLALFAPLGHVGIALATAAAGWVSAVLLARAIARRIGFALDADARRRLPRIGAAAAGMGVLLAAAEVLLAWPASGAGRLAALLVLVAFGLAAYVALLQLLGVARARALIGALRKPI